MGILRTITQRDPSKTTRSTVYYQFGGKRVCISTFLFVNNLGKKQLENLIDYFAKEELCVRVHKNKGKLPHNHTDYERKLYIKGFIEKYADNHAMPLPSRLPAFKDYRVMLLPSDMSKSSVYRCYVEACNSEQSKPVCRWTFGLSYVLV